MIDTARVDRFGAYGYARRTTPHIDELTRDAVLYRGVRSTAPWTLPAHASMLTGQRPGEHGLHFEPRATDGVRFVTVGQLRPAARKALLAPLLEARGYLTIGISNNRWISDSTGLSAGFDHFYLLPPRSKQRRRAMKGWLGRPPERSTPAGQSLELLQSHLQYASAGRPLFVFLNLIEPHFPYLPVEGFSGRFGGDEAALRAAIESNRPLELRMVAGDVALESELLSPLYDEELAQVDAAIGELLDTLREYGLYDDALIVITSDHGELLGEDGLYSHQLSMRPELLDVPLVVKYPGGAMAGSQIDLPLASVADVHQTLLAATWPDNPHAGLWSQDLARPEDFDRDWNIAEYYYSPWYLNQLVEVAEDFDRSEHEVVRRVVLTSTRQGPLRTTLPDDGQTELPTEIRREVTRYLQSIEEQRDPGSISLDAADVEDLRELGYVE